MPEYALERGVAKNQATVVVAMLNAVGTHLQLLGAFLTANIQNLTFGHPQYRLKRERALSYTRLSAKQHYRARHKPAAKHSVQLGVVHVHARLVYSRYLRKRHGAALAVS